MMKQDYYLRIECSHEGCKEKSLYHYSSRREYIDAQKRIKKWVCTRHSNPGKVLSISNLKKETILIADKSDKFPELNKLFWSGGSGFVYGTGYKAWANDFPKGTILKVTAEIILPNEK